MDQDIEKEDVNGTELCLVCCSKVESSKEKDNWLNNSLLVIFLLKNLLQVPDEPLVEYLRENGNPVDWIVLCEECCQLTRQALDLHCQVIKIDRQLCSVQKLIVEKTRSSLQVSVPKGSQGHQSNVWKKTRIFVKQANIQSGGLPVNPFIEGDKLATANYWLRQLDKLRSIQEDDQDLANLLKMKSEQLMSMSQVSSDNDDGDNDWHMDDHDDDEDKDQLNSEDNLSECRNEMESIPQRKWVRVSGKIRCTYCPKLFYTSSGCSKHEQEKHASIPNQYPCSICGMAWNSGVNLQKHMLRKHDVRLNLSPISKLKSKLVEKSSQLEDQQEMGNENCKNSDASPIIAIPSTATIKMEPSNDDETEISDVVHVKEEGDGDEIEFKIPEARKEIKVRKRIGGKVKCYYCEKLFTSRSGCYRHELEKHASKLSQFPCDICGKAWNSKEYLMRHQRDVHKNGYKKKNFALHHSKSKKRVRNRMRINGKIKCDYCDKLFSTISGCYRHEYEKHAEIPAQFPCDVCGKVWNSKEYLESHKKRVHEQGSSTFKSIVKSTKRNETRMRIDGKIKCRYCDKLFAGSNGCLRHEQEKHAEILGQFRCDICDKAWNSKEYLSRHLTKAHGLESEEKKEFFPTILDHSSSSHSLINGNGGTESQEISTENSQVERKPSDNNQVDEGDWDADYLQLDDVRSPDENEDEKDVRKKMSEAMGLVLQKSTERIPKKEIDKLKYSSRDKKFSCKLCDMKFRDKYGLGRHERSHKNAKRENQKAEVAFRNSELRKVQDSRKLEWVDGKVKCSKCDKQFTTVRGLRYHETSHKYRELISKAEGEDVNFFIFKKNRKFEWVDGKIKCTSCDREFCTESGFLQHEREQHKKEKGAGEFICELCGKVCTQLYRLKDHKRRVHLLNADGTPSVRSRPRKKDGKEEYGLPSKNGRGKEGLNYLRVDGKLKCNSCDKLFFSAAGLYKHEQAKHPKRPGEFVCTHCGLAFNCRQYLRVHTERKHWLRLDGTEKIPPWVPTRKFKWKKSEK